jgi:hypothetical protein
MKETNIFFVLLSLSITAGAQVKKVYGFSQELYSGVKQDNDLSGGKASNGGDLSSNTQRYFLFIETIKYKRVDIEQVWIKGFLYNYKIDTIKTLPFILENSNGGEMILKDTLVKSSKEEIIQLKNLAKANYKATPKKVRKLVAEKDIVIVFGYKKRLRNITLRKLSTTKPLFTQ